MRDANRNLTMSSATTPHGEASLSRVCLGVCLDAKTMRLYQRIVRPRRVRRVACRFEPGKLVAAAASAIDCAVDARKNRLAIDGLRQEARGAIRFGDSA